jgi:hypothetical protein
MKDKGKAEVKIRKMLSDAYWGKEDLSIDNGWQDKLMSRIREMGSVPTKALFWPAFEQLVWRIAPVTCVMVVAVTAVLVRLYITTQYNGLQLIASYVEELVIKQIFGT